MSFDAITNRGEYLSAHYLAEVLPETLKRGLLKRWAEEQRTAGRVTPRASLRRFRGDFFDAKAEIADLDFDPDRLRKHHQEVLRALGFDPQPQNLTVERNGREFEIPVAHGEISTSHGIIAIDCGWAIDTDAAHGSSDAALLLDPVTLDGSDAIVSGAKLAAWLFGAEQPPRYVLLLNGGVITLADRSAWGEGRYLAVSLDVAYGRNDDRELDIVAALFGADSLRPPVEGGSEPLADLLAGSRQHAVGVSGELREGLRTSVELIANEVLDRIREAGYQPQQVMDLDELAKELGREALRYLYRILFLLYAEARPELGVLPVNDPEYAAGYSMARLGDLVARRIDPSTLCSFHLYESLDLLFRMVNTGHRPRAGAVANDKDSDDVGLRFEPMRSDLFLPEKTKLIGRQIPRPGTDPDDPDGPKLDTRLRDATLYQVLRLLMLTKGDRRRRGGFVSYAQLGINQLGAVYEGLMSYSGFVATEPLFEVAKNGEPKDGSWMIPASKVADYEETVFVSREDPITGVRSRREYKAGQFVYRLAGRERQTSASYYTPQSLTEVTVQLALKYRLDQDGAITSAREMLDWTVCEPALGSGAFLNEAINQLAAEYLRRRQDELQRNPDDYQAELQKVKAYIALHNCYGVDLNRTAVELAEVSLWLNVMHAGLQAPWFGLHLRRGNSLIGARRQVYTPDQLAEKAWLTTAPVDVPFRAGSIPDGSIHHFLLPADGWGAIAGEKEARELAPTKAEVLKKWRAAIKRVPATKKPRGQSSQVQRLQGLARRVEYLWDLVQHRLTISEQEVRRHVDVWEAENLPTVTAAVPREKILADLEAPGTPYWRLKTLMDTWCALWFWPLHAAGLLDGSADIYAGGSAEVKREKTIDVYEEPTVFVKQDLFGVETPQQLVLPKKIGTQKVTVTEQLRRQTPLANLEDWLTFAEALVGRVDFPQDSLLAPLSSLAALDGHEDRLAAAMGMDEPYRLGERFPWLDAAVKIADEQGFFHWELTFAHAFTAPKGGFDVQVGNPPWVRPTKDEPGVLAELEPWFMLAEKAPSAEWARRRSLVIGRACADLDYFLNEITIQSASSAFIGSVTEYPLLVGTQPNLYRAFMIRCWTAATKAGIIGLIHPDSHLSGTKEGALRGAAYRHLRMHAHFSNRRLLFPEIEWTRQFGLHIYGTSRRSIEFTNASWLFDPATLVASLVDNGAGEAPGIKVEGKWDLRPHAMRLVRINEEVLTEWRNIAGDDNSSPDETKLLYPVSLAEQGAIAALSRYPRRLSGSKPQIAAGLHEANDAKRNIIRWDTSDPDNWSEVVYQGPLFGVSNPFGKRPRIPCRLNRDYDAWDLTVLGSDVVPRTNLRRAADPETFHALKERWVDQGRLRELVDSPQAEAAAFADLETLLCRPPRGDELTKFMESVAERPYTDFYRLAWRRMIPFDTERSLFTAILPPGPTHVNTVYTMALSGNRETALVAGFWSTLSIDYLLRISGRSDLHVREAGSLPVPQIDHPLADPLLVRTLRLNCLTSVFGSLWEELFDASWRDEGWAIADYNSRALGDVGARWGSHIPLRTDRDRRAALVELDALVAVWLGIAADELIALFKARYPVLSDYESVTYFDAVGRRLAGNHRVFGIGQTKEHFGQLIAHLEDNSPVPDGYTAPFYKADREDEYRQAHAVFSKRLQDAIDDGWRPE